MNSTRKGVLIASAAGLAMSVSAQAQFGIVNNISGSFTDISATGTALVSAPADDNIATFTSSVTNSLVPTSNLQACVNGWVAAAGFSPTSTYSNVTLPTAPAGSLFLCAFWDDLYLYNTNPPAGVLLHKASNEGGVNVEIIEWSNVRPIGVPAANAAVNFEIKIWDVGGPALVQFLYQDMTFGGTAATANGASATVGVQWATSAAYVWSFNSTSPGVPNNAILSAYQLQDTGGCCIPSSLTCTITDAAGCTSLGGTFAGAGTACPGACPSPGACCLPNATCIQTTSASCTTQNGTYRGDSIQCAAANCPFGACCATDGTCTVTIPTTCTGAGGAYHGDGSSCANANCPQPPGQFAEVGEAGDLPGTANVTVGTGSLTAIVGTIAAVNDADMFAIQICDPANFSASDVGGPIVFDSVLMLFNADGTGHAMNDDDTTIASFSYITNTFTSGPLSGQPTVTTPGLYYLAVSRYNQKPRDASSNLLWNDTPYNGNRAPDGLGAANPISSWTGGDVHTETNIPYRIVLTGSCFAQASGPTCYANCDGSTGTPFLNVADFTCFLQKFSTGNPYANCDGSTNIPVLNVADFTCFLQKFSIGCSAP
jgi:hypothetical protein